MSIASGEKTGCDHDDAKVLSVRQIENGVAQDKHGIYTAWNKQAFTA